MMFWCLVCFGGRLIRPPQQRRRQRRQRWWSSTWMAFDSIFSAELSQSGQQRVKKNTPIFFSSNIIMSFVLSLAQRASKKESMSLEIAICCFYRCSPRLEYSHWLSCHIILANFFCNRLLFAVRTRLYTFVMDPIFFLWADLFFRVCCSTRESEKNEKEKRIVWIFYVKYDRGNFVTQLFRGFFENSIYFVIPFVLLGRPTSPN